MPGSLRSTFCWCNQDNGITCATLAMPYRQLKPVKRLPLTNSISLCFLTVLTRGSWSSSSSSATNIVSSTSPRTRLQCESYACLNCQPQAVCQMTACKHTCSRPFNSRSPRNLTRTISSMHRRTRSSGSLVSSLSSIVGCVLLG